MKISFFLALLFPLFFPAQDFANFARYQKQNNSILSENIAVNTVFMGDSITEGWWNDDPGFFRKNNFAGRGISGQTTSQMLLRFREDVIKLHPKRVVILAGINDIAENTGPISLDKVFGNIVSMTELAQTNNIKVILCSVLPAYEFAWRKGMQPAEKVLKLNLMIKDYAQKKHLPYIDYHTAMKDSRNGLYTRRGTSQSFRVPENGRNTDENPEEINKNTGKHCCK